MKTEFDIDRIIKIEIYPARKERHTWLPRKQKRILFGLIPINSYYREGWYNYGFYQECYESSCMDARPSTKEELIKYGYIVLDNNEVYRKPYVSVFLESKCHVNKTFETYPEAIRWVNELKEKSKKSFETIK